MTAWPHLEKRTVSVGSEENIEQEMARKKQDSRESNAKGECAHCGVDCGCELDDRIIMDSGGTCPVCKGELCRRCVGGWC